MRAATARSPCWRVVRWRRWSPSVARAARTPLDAIPDLSDTQVIVFTEWMGRSPDLVEDQITYPIVTALRSRARRAATCAAQSMFGMSFVYVDLRGRHRHLLGAQPRARVPERDPRPAARRASPRRSAPTRPASAGSSSTRWWTTPAQHDLAELRSFQDWTLRYWLQSVRGVAEVASRRRLREAVPGRPRSRPAAGLRRRHRARSLRRSARSNNDVGGRRGRDRRARVRRARARLRPSRWRTSRRCPVKAGAGGTPVPLRRPRRRCTWAPSSAAASPSWTARARWSAASWSCATARTRCASSTASRSGWRRSQRSLPPGVQIVVTYDRSELIQRVHRHAAARRCSRRCIVVSLIIVVFLLHFRSALVPILALPDRRAAGLHPDVLPGAHRQHHVAGRHRDRHRRDGGRVHHHGRERAQEARGVGGRRPAAAAARGRDRGLQEVGPADLLLAAGDHRLVPARLHAGGAPRAGCSSRSRSPRPTRWRSPRCSPSR